MKIVIQIVNKASVTVDNKLVSSIGFGEMILVSFTETDTYQTVDKMIDKVLKLRIFEDENGKTNLSIKDKDGEILAVSQFTLYADLYKTNRPSFIKCLNKDKAVVFYDYFCEQLKQKYSKVKFGIFHADMIVSLDNKGPFTIILDSKELGYE